MKRTAYYKRYNCGFWLRPQANADIACLMRRGQTTVAYNRRKTTQLIGLPGTQSSWCLESNHAVSVCPEELCPGLDDVINGCDTRQNLELVWSSGLFESPQGEPGNWLFLD